MSDQIRGLSLSRPKLLLTLTVMAAMLLALVLSVALVRNASAAAPVFVLEDTIGGFNLAIDVAVAANDDIRVIDQDSFDPNLGLRGKLKAFDKDGVPLPTNTVLREAGGIAIDADGKSVVSEFFAIATRSATGGLISSFPVPTHNSFGVDIDADGNIIVAQSAGGRSGRLALYSSGGNLIAAFGDTGDITFNATARGVAVDSGGKMYASDPNNMRVLAFTADGTSVFARGTLKKCVNSQAVYPLTEQHGLKARERRYTAHEEGNHRE